MQLNPQTPAGKLPIYQIVSAIVLLLLTGGCRDSSADDVILAQNGGRQIGTLQGCLNAVCQFRSAMIPQATIAWIGLHQAEVDPP
jgi:hypothetical protein